MYRIDYFQLGLEGPSLHRYQNQFASFVGKRSGGAFSPSVSDIRAPLSTESAQCVLVCVCLYVSWVFLEVVLKY